MDDAIILPNGRRHFQDRPDYRPRGDGTVISIDNVATCIRSALCAPLEVSPVPVGYHIETGFLLPDGDPLSFYMVEDEGGTAHFEDDGTTIPDAVASGFDLKSQNRSMMLSTILSHEGCRVDGDLIIRSESVETENLGRTCLKFISAMIRTRDLFVLSRENVAGAFADDVKKALAKSLPAHLVVDEKRSGETSEADIVVRDTKTDLKRARVFAANSDVRLLDALTESMASGPGDSPVIAVVDRRRPAISEKRFNRATNHGLMMAVVDDNSTDWLTRVNRLIEQNAA